MCGRRRRRCDEREAQLAQAVGAAEQLQRRNLALQQQQSPLLPPSVGDGAANAEAGGAAAAAATGGTGVTAGGGDKGEANATPRSNGSWFAHDPSPCPPPLPTCSWPNNSPRPSSKPSAGAPPRLATSKPDGVGTRGGRAPLGSANAGPDHAACTGAEQHVIFTGLPSGNGPNAEATTWLR